MTGCGELLCSTTCCPVDVFDLPLHPHLTVFKDRNVVVNNMLSANTVYVPHFYMSIKFILFLKIWFAFWFVSFSVC